MQNLINVRNIAHTFRQYVINAFVIERMPDAGQKSFESIVCVDGDRLANFFAYPLNRDN